MSVSTVAAALCAFFLAVGAAAGAWWVHRHSRAATGARVAWFDAVAVSPSLLCGPTQLRLSTAHLLDSLGAAEAQRWVLVRHRLVPGELGSTRQVTLGIAAELAGRMPAAAAACEVLVVPAEDPETKVSHQPAVGHQQSVQHQPTTGAQTPEFVEVPSAVPWVVGMDGQGQSVTVHPVPGATIVALGAVSAPPNHPWFRVIDSGRARPTEAVAELHRQAWDPAVCRVVWLPDATDADDPRLLGIHADLGVSTTHSSQYETGRISHPHSGYDKPFWPLFAGPGRSAPLTSAVSVPAGALGSSADAGASAAGVRTARVASARAASSSSAG